MKRRIAIALFFLTGTLLAMVAILPLTLVWLLSGVPVLGNFFDWFTEIEIALEAREKEVRK